MSSDSEPMRRLFGEVLAQADAAKTVAGKRSIIMPGPFWMLARAGPALEQIQELLEGVVPEDWPPWFKRNQGAFKADPFKDSFEYCLRHAAQAGLNGQDLCRLIGAVAQTLYCTNVELIRLNRSLVIGSAVVTPPPPLGLEWSDEAEFVRRRPDESGGSVTVGNISLWMGSHIGPQYAEKQENQDAVCALACGDGVVFALADGVSTSLGSRYAAALTVHCFCREAARLYNTACRPEAVLLEAARAAQVRLDQLLEAMLDDPSGPEAQAVTASSSLQQGTVQALLQNTLSGERPFLPSAMAATLIGGVLHPFPPNGECEWVILCIGDGAVEQINSSGLVEQKFTTDPAVTQISESIGPGALARQVLADERVTMLTCTMNPGDKLLISSDGLARGHANSVWVELMELAGDPGKQLRSGNDAAALHLLSDAALAAEARGAGDSLLEDNLSLILLEVN